MTLHEYLRTHPQESRTGADLAELASDGVILPASVGSIREVLPCGLDLAPMRLMPRNDGAVVALRPEWTVCGQDGDDWGWTQGDPMTSGYRLGDGMTRGCREIVEASIAQMNVSEPEWADVRETEYVPWSAERGGLVLHPDGSVAA